MTEYFFRRAQINDDKEIKFIAEIDNTIPAKFDSDFIVTDKMNEDRVKFLKSCKDEDFFEVVLDSKKNIVAFHLVKKIPYFDRFAGRIDTLWVSPAHRMNGLALSLKQRAEKWALTQDLDHLHTWTHSDNKRMISLNKKIGYRIVNYKMRKEKKDFTIDPVTVSATKTEQPSLVRSLRGNQVFTWYTERLWKLAAELPVFEFEVATFNCFNEDVWFGGVHTPTVNKVLEHYRKIAKANFEYPIIFSQDGSIFDGVHRICRAHLDGRKTIPAVKFEQDPEPDLIEDKKDTTY